MRYRILSNQHEVEAFPKNCRNEYMRALLMGDESVKEKCVCVQKWKWNVILYMFLLRKQNGSFIRGNVRRSHRAFLIYMRMKTMHSWCGGSHVCVCATFSSVILHEETHTFLLVSVVARAPRSAGHSAWLDRFWAGGRSLHIAELRSTVLNAWNWEVTAIPRNLDVSASIRIRTRTAFLPY